jgi:hypothetical protein
LIPWTLSKQLSDFDFPKLLGARIVRIATNHDYQSMGYGSRALKLLGDYFEGKIVDINEGIEENNSVRVHDHERIDDEENLNEISETSIMFLLLISKILVFSLINLKNYNIDNLWLVKWF